MPLTDVACRSAKPSQKLRKLSDMAGLQLWIQTNGSRLWRYAYRFGGKQKLLALGKYPEVSLAAAREARDQARAELRRHQDPAQTRKLAKLLAKWRDGSHDVMTRDQLDQLLADRREDSFETVAREYVAKLRREQRAEATIHKTEWLLAFAHPVIGRLPIGSIKPIEVLAALRKVEARGKYETARRLRSTIGSVFRYAIATARANVDPTAGLQGALTTPKVTSRPAIVDRKSLGALLRAIDGFDGQPTTRAALKLMALLFPRPGELRAADWSEFDLESRVWTIPASRAKMRRPHCIPLASQAQAILRDLQTPTTTAGLVFRALSAADRPISENTMNAALRRLGYSKDEATPHGFRATASTLLNESGLWTADAIERQLGHVEGNDVRRVYARGDHWDERVRMMSWWADYLDQLRTGDNVVPLRTRSSPSPPSRTG
jgi:integrase